MTALQTTKVFRCEYADDIALTTNTAHHLQLQHDRFHTYMALKGLMLNVHKTKPWPSFAPIHQYLPTVALNLRMCKILNTI